MHYKICDNCGYKKTPAIDKYCLYCHNNMGKRSKLFNGYQPKTLHGKINRLFCNRDSPHFNDKIDVERFYHSGGRETELVMKISCWITKDELALIDLCGGYIDNIYNSKYTTSMRIHLGTKK